MPATAMAPSRGHSSFSRSDWPRVGACQVVTSRPGLSICTETRTRDGRWLSSSAFDVPAEPYADGLSTGEAAAHEFMRALRDGVSVDTLATLEQAALALRDQRGDAPYPSKRGAAVGFLRGMESFLHYAAARADLDSYAQQCGRAKATRDAERQVDGEAGQDAGRRGPPPDPGSKPAKGGAATETEGGAQ